MIEKSVVLEVCLCLADRMTLPPEMHHVPENELALQQIIGMPEGSFAVIHLPGTGREGTDSYPEIMKKFNY